MNLKSRSLYRFIKLCAANTAIPCEKTDFEIFLAKEQIKTGTTTESDVLALMGSNYRVIKIDTPNVKQTHSCP